MGSEAQEHAPLPPPRCPGAPPEPRAWRRPPVGRGVQSSSPAPGFSRAHRRARELPPCGRRGARVCGAGPRAWLAVIPAAEQPEPPTASEAAAGTAGAPAAACSAAAALPACAGEVRGRFQKLGFQVTRGETWIFAEVTWEMGVDSESPCLVKTHLRVISRR